MKDQYEKFRQRTIQYWFVDGISELAIAGLCLILAVYFYVQTILPTDSLVNTLLNVSLILIILGGVFLVRRLTQVIKSRLTYPRSGYVTYSKKSASRLGTILLALGILALITFMIILEPASQTWMPAVTGTIFALIMLIINHQTRLVRLYLLGFIGLLIGFGLSWAGVGGILGMSAFYGSIALAMGLSGGCTLFTYLHNTPKPQEPSNAE